jgi:hypothetical protein
MTGASVGEAGRVRVRVATAITRLDGGVRRAAGGVRHRNCSYRRELGQLA